MSLERRPAVSLTLYNSGSLTEPRPVFLKRVGDFGGQSDDIGWVPLVKLITPLRSVLM